MAVARVNGSELFYTEAGHGVPCLVMHGGLGVDHTQFREWLDPLGDVLRLIYYDHRGNGRSGRPPIETLTFDQLVADADALRAHLGYDQIAVMGHSYGGCLALLYALRYPLAPHAPDAGWNDGGVGLLRRARRRVAAPRAEPRSGQGTGRFANVG